MCTSTGTSLCAIANLLAALESLRTLADAPVVVLCAATAVQNITAAWAGDRRASTSWGKPLTFASQGSGCRQCTNWPCVYHSSQQVASACTTATFCTWTCVTPRRLGAGYGALCGGPRTGARAQSSGGQGLTALGAIRLQRPYEAMPGGSSICRREAARCSAVKGLRTRWRGSMLVIGTRSLAYPVM